MSSTQDDAKDIVLSSSVEWYPGLRPESLLTPAQLKLLKRIWNDSTDTNSNSNLDTVSLIRTLYSGFVSATGIAEHFHAVASQNGSELVAAHHRNEQLEAGAAEFGIRHKTVMEQVVRQAVDVRQAINVQDRQRRDDQLAVTRWTRELDVQRKEIETLTKQKEIYCNVVKQMRELLICPICCEVALLPKVLGTCGHIACQNCLKLLDDAAFSTLTQAAAAGGASARQHLLARRCPLCRVEIIGSAFPVLPLKGVAALLVENELIEVNEYTVQKSLVNKQLAFEKETAESKHMTALQMGCWAQSQLAQHSVGGVIQRVQRNQWLDGVYILFEAAVSRVFFETFATTLHGKAGGVNVLVNTSQRMLAVQLVNRKEHLDSKAVVVVASGAASGAANGAGDSSVNVDVSREETTSSNTTSSGGSGGKQHLLLKVSTDGRFIVTMTPAPSTNVGIAAAVAPAGGAGGAVDPVVAVRVQS